MMLREEVACILLNYDESSSVKVMMQLKQLMISCWIYAAACLGCAADGSFHTGSYMIFISAIFQRMSIKHFIIPI